jgi:Leucine-rich repeat (LRR) protein
MEPPDLAYDVYMNEAISTELLKEVNSILRELRLINIFLKNSEEKRNEIVKELVWQIGDVAYEALDVIDTFIHDIAILETKHVLREEMTQRIHATMLHSVAKRMEDLNKEIHKIYNNIEKYGIESGEASADATTEAEYEQRREDVVGFDDHSTTLHNRRRVVEEDDMVGFVDDKTTLVELLIEGNPQLDVVSIIGMGGSGKTTLARKIYNSGVIKYHFNCRAWGCISQNFRTRELLLEILKSHMPKLDELTRKKLFKYSSEDELKKKLFRCLQGRRYLVVIENIWRSEVWDEIRCAFPYDSNGSRILITSRNKEVALHASHTPPYLLPFLNKDESWELFRKKVFRGGTCPPELETPGRQIAEGCHGLPLSIVLLAGLLANKEKSFHIWSKFVGHVSSFLPCEEDTTICQKILSLSYTDLPHRLKPCFLYFGIYPEDFEIPVRRLIYLWVAEGFIQHTGHRFPEDVAEIYLEELIDRSLIQVATRRTDGGVKTCRIHALLRDLCISESAKEKFLEVSPDVNLLSANKSRRLSIQGTVDPYISSNPSHPSRSLLFLGQHTYDFDPNHWKWVLENFKLLRMLNFGCVDLYSIPTRIEDLIHLRYLSIESDALKAIPASIGNLINLETLDFRGTFLNCLPKEIWKLGLLRNLYMSGPVSLPNHLDPNVTALNNLRVLSTISLNLQTVCPIASGRIPNLTKLGIWFASDENNSEVVDVLEHLDDLIHLQTLKIINCSERPCLPISYPPAITKITLRHVRIKVRRDMKVLGKLLNLKILKLQSCLLSSKLYVFAGSFPRLQVLKLENLLIKRWKQRRGAMPCLKHLVIKRCIELIMLPWRLQSLTVLQNVEVLWSTSESALMLQRLQMNVGFKLLIYPPPNNDSNVKLAKKMVRTLFSCSLIYITTNC